ncbi:hypothetical protein [Sediminicoccus sp. KRV36]|uniref:hypothetical protein n=1 Tax=Sediminicoccus sp. KRV36 TaxID=3133721 RepID=UPI00200F24E1|nr:hypothetical protein [Sediminicoccus rosea]UPY35521.1 hypothetical protein LHU95_14980 [Sediminicoccus rosea]
MKPWRPRVTIHLGADATASSARSSPRQLMRALSLAAQTALFLATLATPFILLEMIP